MARAGKLDDGDSARGLGIVNVPLPQHFSSDQRHPTPPPLPPPPAAVAGVSRSKRAVRPTPESPPPMPPIPATTSSAIPDTPSLEAAAAPIRTRSRRKTLLQRIEGWWDLGLLDKRQTLSRSRSKTMAEHKL